MHTSFAWNTFHGEPPIHASPAFCPHVRGSCHPPACHPVSCTAGLWVHGCTSCGTKSLPSLKGSQKGMDPLAGSGKALAKLFFQEPAWAAGNSHHAIGVETCFPLSTWSADFSKVLATGRAAWLVRACTKPGVAITRMIGAAWNSFGKVIHSFTDVSWQFCFLFLSFVPGRVRIGQFGVWLIEAKNLQVKWTDGIGFACVFGMNRCSGG